MPRRDGTGPMGQGSMTGRRMGNCETPTENNNTNNFDKNSNFGQKNGMGRRMNGAGKGCSRRNGNN